MPPISTRRLPAESNPNRIDRLLITNYHLLITNYFRNFARLNSLKFKKKMVKHIVSFQLNGSATERLDAARRFKDALMALPEQISVLQSMEVGINENPAEDWDVVLTAVVPTMSDVQTYATHPAHVAAAAIIAPLRRNRACVDYEF